MSSFGLDGCSQYTGNEFPLSDVNFALIATEMMWEFYRPTFPDTLRFHSLDTSSVGVNIATQDGDDAKPAN